jgi:hypothetical protein
MPLIAFIALLWQRRRVLSWFRRGRAAWAARPATSGSSGSRRAPATAGRLGARVWRALDTPGNVARVERLVARLRSAATRADADGPTTAAG